MTIRITDYNLTDLEATDVIYFGDRNTNGSWRFIRDGNDFLVQRRESGAWVEKGAWLP